MNKKILSAAAFAMSAAVAVTPLLAGAQTTPTITSVSPTTLAQGSANTEITVNGSNFGTGAKVRFNGIDKTTTYVSGTQLKATITASDLATAGVYTISVIDGNTESSPVLFTVTSTGLPDTGIGPMDSGTGWNVFVAIALSLLLVGSLIGAREMLSYDNR